MAISLSGIGGSGLDTKSLVESLVSAESTQLNQMTAKAKTDRSAITTLSGVGTNLAALKSAADALKDIRDAGSYTATSSDTDFLTVSSTGNAQPGTYDVEVLQVAKEHRSYSSSVADRAANLNQSGSFTIAIGSGTPIQIDIHQGDTLDDVVRNINQAKDSAGKPIRVSASVFQDSTGYRIQFRGLDTGDANKVTFVENGVDLDLDGNGGTPTSGRVQQQAQDASVKIDGFTVNRPTNDMAGILPGVTFTAVKQTTSPVTVKVAGDLSSLTTKLNAVVSAYNKVIGQIHTTAGYGTTKASVDALAGDSALRTINDTLTRTMQRQYTGLGDYNSLGSIGVQLQRDGTLSLNSTTLNKAFAADPSGVAKLLGKDPNTTVGGALAALSDTVKALTLPDKGVLASRSNSFDKEAKELDTRAAAEQTRLDAYSERLRKAFVAMDQSYSANQSMASQLSRIG